MYGEKKIKCIIWWNEVIQSLTIPVWGIFKFYEIIQTLTILRGSKLNFILFKNKDGEVFRRLAVDWVSLPALILFAHTCMYLAEKHLASLVLFYRLKTRESNSFVPPMKHDNLWVARLFTRFAWMCSPHR